MYAGKIVELADTDTIFEDPKHPYAKALMSAVPHADPDRKMNFSLSGEVADPADLPTGCSFHPRCSECTDLCRAEAPQLTRYASNSSVACHHSPVPSPTKFPRD